MASKVYAGIFFLIENHHGDMVQGALADCFVTEIIMTVVEYLYGTTLYLCWLKVSYLPPPEPWSSVVVYLCH